MSKFIDELKTEHKKILDLYKNVEDAEEYDERENYLKKIKNLLVEHLKKEDEYLYPPLKEEAEKDENFKVALDFFITNIKKVTEDFNEFFELYSTNQLSEDTIRESLKALKKILVERIEKEEGILYMEYDKRVKKS